MITNKPITSLTEIPKRYPNICKNVRWLAHLTQSEAHLVVWAHKNRVSGNIGGKRVRLFGGPTQLIEQASKFKFRNA